MQKRISYFSAWVRTEHFFVDEENVQFWVTYGKEQQFKVVVTDASEPEPNSF